MAVFAICEICKCRREKCVAQVTHAKRVAWVARVHLSRTIPPMQKKFGSKLDKPFNLAESQERQWKTDFERGELSLDKKKRDQRTFEQVADEWALGAQGQSRIREYKVSEFYRVKMFKDLFGSRMVDALTFEDGENWLNDRIEDGKAINTINRDMKPLKWIMDYAVTKGYIERNPFKELKELKGGNIRVRWMSEAEVKELVKAAYELEDRDLVAVINVGVNTGFRKGNLERLTARDVGDIRITALKTKNDKPYDVPLAPDLKPTIASLIKESPTGPLLNTIKLDARFRAAARLAKLYKEKGDPDNVTIHTMRHTFAALYLKRGGNIYTLSKMLGHSSVAITEKVYGHLCPSVIDAQATLVSTDVSTPVVFKIA